MELPNEISQLVADFIKRNISAIYEFARGAFRSGKEEVLLNLESTYAKYLENIADKYSRSKSFFIRNQSVRFYDFYVDLDLACDDLTIENVRFQSIENSTTVCILTGAAGSGKSMVMRHFLLTSLQDSNQVPVFIELRELNAKEISLHDLIIDSLSGSGLSLGESYIKKAIRSSHFIFLLDGYDEVARARRKELEREIFALRQIATSSPLIVSSRPDDAFSGWSDFTVYTVEALTLDKAADLVGRLPFDAEIKSKFTSDLKDYLFRRHGSFLSNPLLLSIMLLTYGESADIPRKLSVFYSQAYDVLFQRHDALKGGYRRKKESKLDLLDFARVFSGFCILSYEKRILQFSHSEAIALLGKAKTIVPVEFDPELFLRDALQAVCLLVEDGLFYVFAHRSFQEYFAARFIAEAPPQVQERIIHKIWENVHFDSVIHLLYEMNPKAVETALVIPKLSEAFLGLGVQEEVTMTHYKAYMRDSFSSIEFRDKEEKGRGKGMNFTYNNNGSRMGDLVRLINGYHGVASFDKNPDVKALRKRYDRFVSKWSKRGKNIEYDLSEDRIADELLGEMAKLQNYPYSLDFLRGALQNLQAAKEKHAASAEFLSEMFSDFTGES